MSRVFFALLVCLLAISFSDALDRKAMHSVRARMQRAGVTAMGVGKDDMVAANQAFAPIKERIRAGLSKVEGDSVAERTFYTKMAADIIPILEAELKLNLKDLDSPNLSDADLEHAAKVGSLIRHELRVGTRAHQSSRSCGSFLAWVASARDYFVYGSSEGPNFAYLVDKAVKELKLAPVVGSAVTPRVISKKILKSSTTTNTAVNKALGIDTVKDPSGNTAEDAPLLALPSSTTVDTFKKSTPPPKEVKVDASCHKSDRVLANLYAKDLALPVEKAVMLYDDEQAKQDDSAPSASPNAVAPPKKQQKP